MRRTFARAGLTGLVVAVLTATLIGAGGAIIQAEPAAAAEDDVTSSAVTLTNKDDALEPEGAPFPDLEVTVSQTKDLVSQGIRVSWTGGEKSERPQSGHGGENILQIAQCWGEDPDHPGHPDRRTCQYGGGRSAGSDRDGGVEAESVHPNDEKYSAELGLSHFTSIPFVAANPQGIVDENSAPEDRVLRNLTTIDGHGVPKPEDQWVDLSANQFYTSYTTNEVKWAGAGTDGSGSVPFEVQTAMQSTALGCGTPIVQPDDTALGQSCWLVIIPRGTGDSGSSSINHSGLFWDAWEHHLAVKLEFKPLGVRCQIGQAERQLAGSELVAGAIASWQPGLCRGEAGAPFVLNESNEADATLRAAGTEPSPLALTSRPLDMSLVGHESDPLAYAPLAISGIAISFAIDRQPDPATKVPEYAERAGIPFSELKLTPRLVAKLLTASYLDALPNGADKDHLRRNIDDDPGLESNPRALTWDTEFREINDPEWAAQVLVGASIADALMPSGRSDVAIRLWEYVLADPEARAWLNGADDGHGTFVNPWYSTNPDVNPTGTGLALPLDSFPKADPAEKPDETSRPGGTGPVNLVTHRPYTSSLAQGAYFVLRGDGRTIGDWEPQAVPPRFSQAPRRLSGSQRVMGLTSTPAAEQYQTVTASLRNPSGQFVLPTQDSLTAAAAAMTPTTSQSRFLGYDFTGDQARAATSSYPLTMPVYAALNPEQEDEEQRGIYANLIRYAVNDGQEPGTDVGQLPPGYAPLPDSWVEQALGAADAIERGSLPQPGGGGTAGSGGTSAGARGGSGASSASTGAPAGNPADSSTGGPAATGAPAGELAGAETPDDPETGMTAAAVPIGIGVGLAAALAVPLVSRVRRRA